MDKVFKTPLRKFGSFFYVVLLSLCFMYLLYGIFIFFAQLFLSVIALFNKKIDLFVSGRKETFEKLEDQISLNDKVIWIHCASLGEFEQGRPIIEKLKIQFPNHKIVLTFFSPSGYEVRKNYATADVVCYLPLDTKSNAIKFIEKVHPELAIFIKYEFWPNILKQLKKKNIETILVSGIFRKKQSFFRVYGSWMRKSLQTFSYFFVQDERSKQLLNSINFKNVAVSGDTRFDRVHAINQQNNFLEFMTNFKGEKLLFVAGSTWNEDEKIIVDYINNCELEHIKFVIAPHNIKSEEIKNLRESINKKVILYSERDDNEISKFDVLIIDTIGILTKIYSYANIAYVGGAFATGLHNVLEPATFGLPIIIGPKYSKFKEVVELVENKGCIVVNNAFEFEKVVNTLLSDSVFRTEKGEITNKYIVNNIGATSMILDYINSKIKN